MTEMCTFLLQNYALWHICQMHCGICEMGLLDMFVSIAVPADILSTINQVRYDFSFGYHISADQMKWFKMSGESQHDNVTHWCWDKMVDILQMTFWNAFSWMKTYEFCFRFHSIFVPESRISNIPALVQIMAWRHWSDKPLSEPMMG